MRRLAINIGANGPLVDLELAITDLRRQAYIRQRLVPPSPVRVTMLVDTGASHTFIDEAALAPLNLSPKDSATFRSASPLDAPDRCNVYDIALTIGTLADRNTMTFDPLPIFATPFRDHRHEGLLGRDVLARLQMAWHGPGETLELLYP